MTSIPPPQPHQQPPQDHYAPAPKKKMKWPWIFALAIGLPLAGMAGCVALIGTAANSVSDSLNEDQQAAMDAAVIETCELTEDRATVEVSMVSPFDEAKDIVGVDVTIYSAEDVNLGTIPVNFQNVQPGESVLGDRVSGYGGGDRCEITGASVSLS